MIKISDRKKRIIFCLSMIYSLIVLNFSLFSVRSNANAVSGSSTDIRHLSIGVPLTFEMLTYNITDNTIYDLLINDANVYYYNTIGLTPSFTAGLDGDPPTAFYDVSYREISSPLADVVYNFTRPTYLTSCYLNYPVLLSSFDDLLNYYEPQIAIYQPRDSYSGGSLLTECNIHFNYTLLVSDLLSDGSLNYRVDVLPITKQLSVASDGWLRVNTLYDGLPSDFFTQYSDFISPDGTTYAWILEARVDFMSDCWSGDIYIEPHRSSGTRDYDEFVDQQIDRLAAVYDSDAAVINFDDVSWTDWLVNSVGSFMNLEIMPNLSIAGIFGLLIGMSLFMVFLKVFAGG